VNLDKDINENDDQVITAEPVGEKYISLNEVLNFSYSKAKALSETFSENDLELIDSYSTAFKTYEFSIVVLRKEDIDSAIEVFTRINTGGQTLTLFEIMAAKTYDEQQNFDMQSKWDAFIEELKGIKYEGISSTVVLSVLSLVLSRTKECKRKTILTLSKQDIIDTWDAAISALKDSIDYFRTTYRIPVSQLLPYDSLLVPFAYFFYHKKDKPLAEQRKFLEEFFWRMSLSFRYSSSTESSLAQDIKRIDKILNNNERPDYSDINVYLESPQTLIDTNFSAGNSYCKAVLCLLAYQEPKDFQDNGKVILDNSWLKVASSKNYHHFFPKAYLKNKTPLNRNSLVNITFVSDHLNKRKIGAKSPSTYIGDFKDENTDINAALNSHFIDIDGYGIESDDYGVFLQERAKCIYEHLKSRIELTHVEPANEEIEELVLGGESDTVEFKSTLRYDLRQKVVNKKLEYVIAKTIAAFLNCEGGNLFIGIDDNMNALGLNDDLSTLKKGDIDGFELQLLEVIKKYIGNEYSTHIKINFPDYDNKKVCRIKIAKSSKPVFTIFEGREDFFVRSCSSSQPLSREEQSAYEKEHWRK
ncbi:MAG: RNA-binding domain-containing protein, partial [Thiohalomonadales bacterium]